MAVSAWKTPAPYEGGEMKYLKQISSIALSMLFLFANSTSGSAQDWPDPLVELVSINADASSYFTDGKIKFNISINRINGSTYSDITRVWICPKPSWDGFMCNAGQFLVSTTPNSAESQFTIESPVLTLADGEYLITGVSFRNGAVITGFTLMYPRTGVVTIGGIATTIGLVNLAAADFVITTPAPEPEPVVEPEPDPIPEPDINSTESESATDTEPATEPSTEPETNTEPATEPTAPDGAEPPATEETSTEAGTESGETTDPSTETTTELAAEDSTQLGDAGSGTNESESSAETESTSEPAVTEPEESEQPAVESETSTLGTENDVNQPNVNQPAVTVPPVVTQSVITQSVITRPETSSSTTEIKTLTPNVAAEIKPETVLTITESTPAVLPAMKRQLITAGAIGGKVLQVTGEAKLIRSVSAGTGRLKLIGSNDSVLLVKLGSKVITQVNLAKDQVISWRSNRPAKLKLILSGESAELNIDALQLNGRLIANPSFQMRS